MMRSATAFLPPSMITFMNLDSSTLPNLGSGRISRLGTSRRRGIFYLYLCFSWRLFRHRESQSRTPTYSTRAEHLRLGPLRCTTAPRGRQHRKFCAKAQGLFGLGLLGTVLGTRLLAVFHALQVERTADDVVTHTGQVLDTTAANQHHAVFLQVVAFTADVGDHLKTVGQAHLGDLAQSGVGLLGRRGVHTGAHTAALRRVFHRRTLGFGLLDLTPVTHELVNGWHELSSLNVKYENVNPFGISEKPSNVADSPQRSKTGRRIGGPPSLHQPQRRIASQARPSTPACSTPSRATRGSSRSVCSPSTTLSVPTSWPWLNGATSGSRRAIWVVILPPLPAGTATTIASGRPLFTILAWPFQTAGVSTLCPASNSLTASKAV